MKQHHLPPSLFKFAAGLAAGVLLTATGFAAVPPAEAVASLDVGEGLEASLFASEPLMLSPSSIDIDHLGRVWVCEVINYRGHNGKRPEGDRILVLEDSNGDGTADKSTVFYQGRDIDSAHGICVLGNQVIVSAGDNVWVMTDENGDLKSDKKEALFTKIGGAQHDHGIHAFSFGPDGKLYFNFGNASRQLADASGKIITDKAGNEVKAGLRPYQQGMAFRCDLDGSNVETLGWNFRNNWEVCVDAFGTVWQSDNDDDGNKGVRINFVMEFGNYGYRDEFTGKGWGDKRTNMEKEIPLRHWHLNDPGVVPNLLQTGQGSPTGIVTYEGSLLPEIFRNQVIHCDAGPNVTRAYPVKTAGAGYTAEVVDILKGARDNWFRPSDVCVAPDGSLLVADWYDPGVGGHAMRDLERGRIFRVAVPGSKYSVPKVDLSTPDGAAMALVSPNGATRYLGWTALQKMGDKATPAL
ncbi:MAG: dehydrogenase, partial [Verrucomicrobia bacterium]|nr:dehydrogenase [Verrucomicrobiota bacterium]